MSMEQLTRKGTNYNYYYEETISASSTVIVKIPEVSPNKRSISDIGWLTDGDDLKVYGTFASNPEDVNALWQEIEADSTINKAITALKIDNSDGAQCKINIRVIME